MLIFPAYRHKKRAFGKLPKGPLDLRRYFFQSELAKESGVPLRSIQMYEQRNNNIDKAQAQTVYKLSRVLGCNIEDLLENPMQI